MLNKKGFTLAEILITLGIIGVVAAITIPTLIKNTQDAEFKSAWKKEYSALTQATVSYLQDNGTFKNTYAAFRHDYLKADYVNYLKTVKVCSGDPNGETTYGSCWSVAGGTKYINGSTVPLNALPLGNGSAGIILQDGASVLFGYQDNTCTSQNILGGFSDGLTNVCGWIAVDVNGAKGPNTVGKDVFGIWVLDNKILPMGTVVSDTTTTGLSYSASNLMQ